MIEVRKYNPINADLWDAFIDTSKNGTFLLKRAYMEYHSDRFVDHSLMFYDDNELIALLPASEHNVELRSHGGLTYGGIVCSYSIKQHKMNACVETLLIYMRQHGIDSMLYKPMPYIYHRYPCQEDLYALWNCGARLVRRNVATVVEFTPNPIKLPKGRKAQIARAKREGIVVERSVDFERFIALENDVLGQYHGAKAVHSGAELGLLYSRFPNNISLYVAKHENILVAGVCLLVYDNMLHTQYMANSNYGRENGALDLLIATIMDDYRGSKRFLDFGTSMEQEGINEGLISQKESFGGRSVMYDFYELKA